MNYDKLHIVLNEHIDLVYNTKYQRVEVRVDEKVINTCAGIVASFDSLSGEKASNITSIDDLVDMEGARVLHSKDLNGILTPAEELFVHASNIQVWIEHDYDTRVLHSNMAFPLLAALCKAGDAKARRCYDAIITERIKEGTRTTLEAIAASFLDELTDEHWARILEKIPSGGWHQPGSQGALFSRIPLAPRALAYLIDNNLLDTSKFPPNYRLSDGFGPGSLSRPHMDWLIENSPILASSYKYMKVDDMRRLAALHVPGRVAIWAQLLSLLNLPDDLIVMFSQESNEAMLRAFSAREIYPRHLIIKFVSEGSLNLMRVFLYKVRDDPAIIEEILERSTPEWLEEIKKDLAKKEEIFKKRKDYYGF